MRAGLSPSEEAAHLARRKELFEAKGGLICPTLGGDQKVGFAKDTAEKTGHPKRDINRKVARAEAIPNIDRAARTS